MSDSEFVAATEERSEIPSYGSREIQVPRGARVFRVSDELAAQALLDWSEPVQLKLARHEDGTYDLVARLVNPPAFVCDVDENGGQA